MRHLFIVLLALVVSGCAGKDEPLTSRGKPVAYWLGELKNAEPKARKKAVVALGHVGNMDPAAMSGLISALEDADTGVRDAAVLALLNIGAGAKAALTKLKKLTSDPDSTVRDHATKAVARIQSPN